MILFPYEGPWCRLNPAPRHPELLTQLAPPEFQRACVEAGGRNWYGKPNFRLVVLRSRYQHCGGFDFPIIQESEGLVPRYPEAPAYQDCFLLEQWKPPEWYDAQGFGQQNLVEWSITGKAIHKLEPIPSQGGYEAVHWDANVPMYFSVRRHWITWQGKPVLQERVTPHEIREAIRAARDRQEIEAAAMIKEMLEQQAAEEVKASELYGAQVAEKMTLFDGIPGTAITGPKPVSRI